MATYDELLQAANNDLLRQRVRVAVTISANTIILEPTGTANHAARLAWARGALQSPDSTRDQILLSVLAQNKSFTLVQITGATDASIQTAVDAAVLGVAV